jgi:arylsulfatase A-like enzyme
VSIIDIGPTLTSLVGLPPDPSIDGKDLTSLLKGDTKDVRDFIFAQRLTPKDDQSKYSIIEDGYKYVVYQFGDKTFEGLFDLKEDFGEQNKLSLESVPQYEALKARLAELNERTLKNKIDSKNIQLSEDKKEQLKALGYIE